MSKASEEAAQTPGPTREISRRQFISKKLANEGMVSYAEITEKFGEVSRQQLKVDAKILHDQGINIQSTLVGRNGVFFSPQEPFHATYEFRKRYHTEGKDKIGKLVAALTLCARARTVEEVENAVSGRFQFPKERERSSLSPKLEQLLKKTIRVVIMDAGTTAVHVAEHLAGFDPLRKDNTRDIEVWTNSRHIFSELGRPDCEVRTGMIGGRQAYKKAAISGPMANRFVSDLLPMPDLAIIGASAIATSDSRAFTSSPDDAQLKRVIMQEKSQFTILIVDSSKFSPEAFLEEVCPIEAGGMVDLIATDEDPGWAECPVPILIASP